MGGGRWAVGGGRRAVGGGERGIVEACDDAHALGFAGIMRIVGGRYVSQYRECA